ncbi:NAD(P)/FAD-dependent oxidoreductase [Brucepastera parasyntrophica]|uniref:NAD(P)/FAD-dependent oxidoreductase n=1 Tax=Brucepastera parasyntrophica TaxID=2880008 RepID=UPI00210D2DEA|nr:NAD(P)/FAD-dependent oxidoreductase [Brucepastera parasyntrophica]ULQ59382.1 NAD(P)/FAD-dependent oxidoreductase [Brucepastera parasyntrophica]
MNRTMYDVAIIGAGVTGTSIARKLSRYKLRIALLEKEADVSFGTSKANSGIIHGGFHHNKKYLKARLEISGAAMFDQLQRELGFPFRRCGILVAAMHHDEMEAAAHLFRQGQENGAPGIEFCSRERMLELEPKLSQNVVGGVYAPSGGIIEPYRFVFSLLESAVKNGTTVYTEFEASHAEWAENCWNITASDGRNILARYAVNAAGLYADNISKMFGAEEYTIEARKGAYFLLDRLAEGHPQRVVFPVPSRISKGMLVIPTVEGTTLIGPTADHVDNKEDKATEGNHLALISASAKLLVPSVSEQDAITNFAGLRPALNDDFYIAFSEKVPRFLQVAGIQSPGLTAAPAIARMVKDMLLKDGLELSEDPSYDPFIRQTVPVRTLPAEKRAELVEQNPAYGNIVCRCEEISEAEIVEAIRHGHTTLDGIKFYTRAQMGRCQGGFCTGKIIRLIQRETEIPYNKITKRGGDSLILEGEL